MLFPKAYYYFSRNNKVPYRKENGRFEHINKPKPTYLRAEMPI